MEDRRDLDPAPPARPPAAAAAAPPQTEMGGPGAPGGLLTLIPEPRRHEQHLLVTPDTILRWHRGIVRRRWAATSRTRHDRRASYPPGHQGPGPPAGPREPRLGLPQDPWRTGRAGGTSPGIGSMGDLEKCGHRSRAAAERAGVAAVPARPGRGDRGVRLLHSRPSRWHPGLCPGRDRARQPAHQDSRSHLHPTGSRTARQARNLLMDLGERAHRVKFMIRDRGSNFTAASGTVLADAGIRTVLCNVRTPRMNAIAGRWIGGCRRELLDRTLGWNQ